MVDGSANITFENFHPLAERVQDFLIAVAEPIYRATFLHEYKLATHSLYAAVSVGLDSEDIIETLNIYLKTKIPPNVSSIS